MPARGPITRNRPLAKRPVAEERFAKAVASDFDLLLSHLRDHVAAHGDSYITYERVGGHQGAAPHPSLGFAHAFRHSYAGTASFFPLALPHPPP